MKVFDSVFASSERTLSLRGQRMEVLSRNIANADTPNFKAQDLDFKAVLKNTQPRAGLSATHHGHIKETKLLRAQILFTPFHLTPQSTVILLS
jgi:flagellar basal-body rod protein FlgB